MRRPAGSKIVAGLALALALTNGVGCSDVSIQKIPNRSDYRNWTDEDQRRVDAMCGKRVYGKRPYVEVKKPFVVASRTYLVDAVSSHDGKFLRVVGTRPLSLPPAQGVGAPPEHWKADLGAAGLDANSIPFASVVKSPGVGITTDAQGRVASAQGASTVEMRDGTVIAKAQGDGDVGTVDPGALDSIAPHASAEDRPSGTTTMRLSTNLKAIGYKELNDYFDLVYLPDFEEQYIISPVQGLGSVDLSVTQGPGDEWLAMGMRVDNSAITRPLVDAYAGFIKSGAAAAQEAMGIAQGDPANPESVRTAPDKLITLRMHVVKMATPGLYPVLKATEMLENRHTARELHGPGYGACRTTPPWKGQCQDVCETHVLPVYPYSRIAYQVHTTVIFEHLVTTETTRQLPAFSQGAGAAPAATGEPATLAAIQQLVDMVVNVLDVQECMDVTVVRFSPQGVPIEKLERVELKVTAAPGMGPAAVQTCQGRIRADLNDIPSLKNATIVYVDG